MTCPLCRGSGLIDIAAIDAGPGRDASSKHEHKPCPMGCKVPAPARGDGVAGGMQLEHNEKAWTDAQMAYLRQRGEKLMRKSRRVPKPVKPAKQRQAKPSQSDYGDGCRSEKVSVEEWLGIDEDLDDHI